MPPAASTERRSMIFMGDPFGSAVSSLARMAAVNRNSRLKKLGKVFLRRNAPVDDADVERLVGEDLDGAAVFLEAVGMEVGAHHCLGFLQFGFEPGRDVRK